MSFCQSLTQLGKGEQDDVEDRQFLVEMVILSSMALYEFVGDAEMAVVALRLRV